MGYLSAKDLGYLEVSVNSGLYEGSNASPDGTKNTTTNDGILNLKSYSFSFNTGKVVNSDPNIAGNITRLSLGSKKPIPIELKAYFSRKPNDGYDASELTADEMTNLSYLTEWSRNKNIIMFFYTPNSAEELNHGQDNAFYTSELKCIYDSIWDKNLGTNPYTSTTYGSTYFDTGKQFNSVDYQACAIPVIIEDVVALESGDKKFCDVSIKGYVIENEGH